MDLLEDVLRLAVVRDEALDLVRADEGRGGVEERGGEAGRDARAELGVDGEEDAAAELDGLVQLVGGGVFADVGVALDDCAGGGWVWGEGRGKGGAYRGG